MEMKTSGNLIRIKIALRPMNQDEFEALEEWENEGGPPPGDDDDSLHTQAPLKPGDSFRVVKGRILYEEGYCFYAADIEKLD